VITVNSGKKRIKDLKQSEFKQIYDCDLFTAALLSNAYRYMAQRMCRGLQRTAFSIILRDWYDVAAALSGPPEMGYPMVAVSDSVMTLIGTIPESIRNTAEEFGPENLEPGDIVVCNDPQRIGSHAQDCIFVRPLYWEGRIVAFVNMKIHLIDMGGTVPGGFSGTKRNKFEDGLILPPMLLYHKDKPVRPTWQLFFDNTRFGEILLTDIKAAYQNMLMGEKEVLRTIEKYGLDVFHGAMRYLLDASEESMRQGLSRIPDGDYEAMQMTDCDAIDDREEYPIRLKIRVRGDRAEIDLSGTHRQARTSINAGAIDAKCAVMVAMKYLLDPKSPITSAIMRPFDILVPAGSVLRALPPDGAICLYFESSEGVLTATFEALAPALGEDAIAGCYGCLTMHSSNGVFPDGRPWLTVGQVGGEHGPLGATKAGDGVDGCSTYFGNGFDPATEAIELDTPVILLRKENLMDSAGAGKYRGGLARVTDFVLPAECESYSMPLHYKVPTGFGVNGGQTGSTGGVWTWSPEAYALDKEKKLLPLDHDTYRKSKVMAGVVDPETHLPDREKGLYFYPLRSLGYRNSYPNVPGTIWRYITNSAGGWGDPLERDFEAVKRDVRNEYVSIEGARRDYGVVITGDPHWDPENLVVDLEATEKLRGQLKRNRLVKGPDYLERRKGPEGYDETKDRREQG
jgi:N-methylhydantoinase B